MTRTITMLGLLLTAASCSAGDETRTDGEVSTAAVPDSSRTVGGTDVPRFTADDEAAVRSVEEAYRTAWLDNDSSDVMTTLADDAVLMPAGMVPIRGGEAIRAYWWPDDGSSTVIEAYRINVEEVEGSGDLAYLRGRGFLTFTYRPPAGEESRTNSESVHLSVLRRGDDGTWRIARRVWSSLPAGG